jgi:uncharacterized protein (DUF924 family)
MIDQVLTFWFEELSPKMWWVKDSDLDEQIAERFSDLLHQATQCELSGWRNSPEGSLAEIIVLDQFSRNIYRDTAKSFSNDPLALCLSQQAISKGFDLKLDSEPRSFMYLPFMHSESAVIHQEALKLYERLGDAQKLDFELRHKAIIDRFGRYPHRNQMLGRTSTEEELAFLEQPGSSF